MFFWWSYNLLYIIYKNWNENIYVFTLLTDRQWYCCNMQDSSDASHDASTENKHILWVDMYIKFVTIILLFQEHVYSILLLWYNMLFLCT